MKIAEYFNIGLCEQQRWGRTTIWYNAQGSFIWEHDYTQQFNLIVYVLLQIPLVIPLIFPFLQQLKVDRYAGGNQALRIKVLTEWNRNASNH